jgi:predicted RNA binding protein YcfA (HicA-like mRNA interferase family)
LLNAQKEFAVATKGKVRDALRIVRKDGWVMIKSHGGSHRQFKHPEKSGRVTINGHEGDDLPVWLWDSIMAQAGL